MIQIKTFEQIMDDMLGRIPDKYDKRQGSAHWNLLAPAAQELAIQYTVLEEYLNLMFLDTSYGDALTRLAKQFGVDRLPATASIREVTFQEPIPLGTRFSVVESDFNFRVIEKRTENNYLVVAEQTGKEANTVQGSLLNIDVLQEFSGAVLGNVLIPAEDEESDDALRKRTIDYVKTPTLNGNVAQYQKWLAEIEGVGSALIQPLWNGNGTVKISITNATGEEASPELVQKVQKVLDPEPKGHGLGLAPIGAVVTVASVAGFSVTITATIKIEEDADAEAIKSAIHDALIEYLRTEAFQEKEVRNYKVATIIDRVKGVKDVDDVTVNGTRDSVELNSEALPKLSEVTINVR